MVQEWGKAVQLQALFMKITSRYTLMDIEKVGEIKERRLNVKK